MGLIERLELAEITYPATHPLAGRRGAVFGYAVRHQDGVFVFDTGVGAGHAWIEEHYRPIVRRIEDELAHRDMHAADVVAIATSHLHFDHCGQNARFAGVPIYVQRREREAARAIGYSVPEWIEFPGARYELVDGEAEPLGGIRLVATPGHTPGHQSALVKTPDAIVALAGHGEGIEARLRALGATRILEAHELRG